MDLLLGNETLSFALADLRLPLMVNDNKGDLGSAETRQALVAGESQREISALVDNLGGGPDRGHGIDADLRSRARQWIEDADLDLLLCLRRCCAGHNCKRRENNDSEFHSDAPWDTADWTVFCMGSSIDLGARSGDANEAAIYLSPQPGLARVAQYSAQVGQARLA